MTPAKNAANPLCAHVSVGLPRAVGGLPKRHTNAQATAAWGFPASILLRCGVEEPSGLVGRCLGVNGVDWIEEEIPGRFIYTTYGRVPSLEVVIDPTKVKGSALIDFAEPAKKLPKHKECKESIVVDINK